MMNDFLTEDTKAIILLCGVFSKERTVKPLTLTEYTKVVQWLMKENLRPADLLEQKNVEHASKNSGLDGQRLVNLLRRGVQLGFAVEEWQRNGIWVISRSDKEYPIRYKKHLKEKSPPLLFGVGNRSLLSGGGLAVVGSRNIDETALLFTQKIGEMCADTKMPVVSGGARGIDITAMEACLNAGGVAIGVLADTLLKKSLERDARRAVAEGRLLLLSPYHPNARFTVGGAMGRNKLIYALADYALVVSAEYKKGGTWSGAVEELNRNNSIPVFVRTSKDTPSGNDKLIELGACKWNDELELHNLQQNSTEESILNQEADRELKFEQVDLL